MTEESAAAAAAPDPDVGPGTVVALHYELRDGRGERVETTSEGEPVRFLFGEGGVLAALQEALRGHRAGDSLTVEIPHGRAYGRRYPGRVRRIARKALDEGGRRLRPGQPLRFRDEQGMQLGTVVKVGRFSVDVDVNHPLAGQDLTFELRIVEVRPASESERAHGHAHGPGGHQH